MDTHKAEMGNLELQNYHQCSHTVSSGCLMSKTFRCKESHANTNSSLNRTIVSGTNLSSLSQDLKMDPYRLDLTSQTMFHTKTTTTGHFLCLVFRQIYSAQTNLPCQISRGLLKQLNLSHIPKP